MSLHLPRMGPDPDEPFPAVDTALQRPDGLLAFGGDLSPARLLNAYAHGIFPWFSEGQPILWWSPDPRTVLRTDGLHLSTRFQRDLKRSTWTVRADTRFDAVIDACAQMPRPGQDGTWITDGMRDAYVELHRLGHAHSVEVLDRERLVGGIYGVGVGRMFFGESMFSGESGGSKVALAALAGQLRAWDWPLIDAQVDNPHVRRLGAERWPRTAFIDRVKALVTQAGRIGPWSVAFGQVSAADLIVAAGRAAGNA